MDNSERALIGSILTDPGCIDLILNYVPGAEYFHNKQMLHIYEAMLKMHRDGKQLDLATVADNLENQNFVPILAQALNEVPTSAHAEEYARNVRDAYARRTLKKNLIMIDPTNTTRYPTPLDAINAVEAEIKAVGKVVEIAEETELPDLINSRFDAYHLEEGQSNKRITPTGFVDLDDIITGLEKGENIVVGARPSVGKTAFALCISLNVAKRGKKAIFFSLEMAKERLVDRLLCIGGKIDAEDFKRRQLSGADKKKLGLVVNEFNKIPLVIVDKQRTTPAIKSILAKHSRDSDVGLVVIDFLQLMRDRSRQGRSRSNEVGNIAKEIQQIAQDFDVPIITLSQLNRKIEDRDDKKPRLSDLYESGDIEAAADKIMFLYRDPEIPGVVEIGIAKQRDGKTGMARLTWLPWCTRFENLSRYGKDAGK